jgi:hypothetical protein
LPKKSYDCHNRKIYQHLEKWTDKLDIHHYICFLLVYEEKHHFLLPHKSTIRFVVNRFNISKTTWGSSIYALLVKIHCWKLMSLGRSIIIALAEHMLLISQVAHIALLCFGGVDGAGHVRNASDRIWAMRPRWAATTLHARPVVRMSIVKSTGEEEVEVVH